MIAANTRFVRRRLEALHALELEAAQVASHPPTLPAPADPQLLAACALGALVYEPGPHCASCDPCDAGCDACCVELDRGLGVRRGSRCPGPCAGEACVALGERLADGAWVQPSGRATCRACAALACCAEGEDCERVESALEAMEG